MNMLVTGSWDKTVKYWDLRQANPVHTQQMPEVRLETDWAGRTPPSTHAGGLAQFRCSA